MGTVDWKALEQDLSFVVQRHGIPRILKLDDRLIVNELSCFLKTQFSLLKNREPWLENFVQRAAVSSLSHARSSGHDEDSVFV